MTGRRQARGGRGRVVMAGPPGRRRRPWLPFAAGLVLLLLVLVTARATDPQPGQPSPAAPARSDVAAVTRAPAPPPEPAHEVYGYVPYWEMDATIAEHVAATHL